jgi:hypothetical protein
MQYVHAQMMHYMKKMTSKLPIVQSILHMRIYVHALQQPIDESIPCIPFKTQGGGKEHRHLQSTYVYTL